MPFGLWEFSDTFFYLEHCVADNAGERNRDAQGKSRPTHCMIYKCRQRAKTGQENKLYWIMNLGFSIVKSDVKYTMISLFNSFYHYIHQIKQLKSRIL